MNNTKSILIVGTQNQPILETSKIIANVLFSKGYDVKISGSDSISRESDSSAVCIKYGDKIYSPVINKGEADIILAFEQLESARYFTYLNPSGVIITNTQKINPTSVTENSEKYPKDIISKLQGLGICPILCDGPGLAKKAGDVNSVNIVLIGALAECIDVDKNIWLEEIKQNIPKALTNIYEKAFELGYNAKKYQV